MNQAALRIVQSDQFDKLWTEANRRAHPQIVALLEGTEGKHVSTKNGEIVLTLGPIAEKVQGILDKAGIDVFTNTSGPPQIVLFSSSDLKSAQGATDLLQKSAWVLPVLTILAFAARHRPVGQPPAHGARGPRSGSRSGSASCSWR